MKKPNYFLKHRLATTVLFLTVFMMTVFFIFSFTVYRVSSDVWSRLGMTEEVGIGNVQSAFLEGYFYQLNPAVAKKIALGERKAIASELLNAARSYMESPAFKEDYEWYKKEKYPLPPKLARTKKEVQTDLQVEMSEAVENLEKMIAQSAPEYRESLTESLEIQKAQLTAYKDPENETVNMIAESEKMDYEIKYQQYVDELKEFEEIYPGDIKAMIRSRLELFLELTEGVDYDAELKTVYGRKVFVDPRFERMHDEWKMAYRCGREVTETARAFANEWLKSL